MLLQPGGVGGELSPEGGISFASASAAAAAVVVVCVVGLETRPLTGGDEDLSRVEGEACRGPAAATRNDSVAENLLEPHRCATPSMRRLGHLGVPRAVMVEGSVRDFH